MAQDTECMFSAGRIYDHVAAPDPLAASLDQNLALAGQDDVDLFIEKRVAVSANGAAGRYLDHVYEIDVGELVPHPNRRREDMSLSGMRPDRDPFASVEAVQWHDSVPELDDFDRSDQRTGLRTLSTPEEL